MIASFQNEYMADAFIKGLRQFQDFSLRTHKSTGTDMGEWQVKYSSTDETETAILKAYSAGFFDALDTMHLCTTSSVRS